MSNTIPKDGLDLVSYLVRGIELEIKQKITEEMINGYLEDLKEKLNKELTKALDRVTFEKITQMSDVLNLRDELRVYIKVNEKTFTHGVK